jgi:hypothetical protein
LGKDIKKTSIMFHQTRSVLSPTLERFIFTPTKHGYIQELERTWVKMGKDEKKWASRVGLVGLFQL